MRVLFVVYDNESYIHWFPIGIGYLAAVLRNQGIDVEIYSQDVHHYPDAHLTDHLDRHRYDVVGYGTIGGYYQYAKLLRVAEAINRSKQRPFFVLGGHGPSPDPAYFLKKTGADAVVIGEGEETFPELLSALAEGRSLDGIRGIAYPRATDVVVTPRRELIADVDSIPWPAYDLFPIEYYRLLRMPHVAHTDFVMPLLSGRGCKFNCNFCYRMDKGFRPRSDEAIIEEIRFLKRTYGISYIAFADELLMSSVERTERLCRKFIQQRLHIKWDCNGRLNYCRPGLLKLMKEAGCVFINYGIEAFDDRILKIMNKALTTRQIVRGIEATLASGISPGLNIIFGNIGENEETLEKGVEFLLQYDDFAQMRTIRPVTPYPGCPLYDYAIEKGLLKGCADFYESKHTNSDLMTVNFTDLSDDDFYRALHRANQRLLENYFHHKQKALAAQMEGLYVDRDPEFRGFRQS